MDKQQVTEWVERYRRAWESNDVEEIAELFTEDALYYGRPDCEPWTPRDTIVEEWIANKDDPGDTNFTFAVAAVADGIAFVRGVSDYVRAGKIYDNLWEITLTDDGKCSRFVEWWMERP